MYWLMTLGARTHIPFSSSRPVGPHLLISQATILGKSRSLIPEGECHVIRIDGSGCSRFEMRIQFLI